MISFEKSQANSKPTFSTAKALQLTLQTNGKNAELHVPMTSRPKNVVNGTSFIEITYINIFIEIVF